MPMYLNLISLNRQLKSAKYKMVLPNYCMIQSSFSNLRNLQGELSIKCSKIEKLDCILQYHDISYLFMSR
jgi:hypothetical protein